MCRAESWVLKTGPLVSKLHGDVWEAICGKNLKIVAAEFMLT